MKFIETYKMFNIWLEENHRRIIIAGGIMGKYQFKSVADAKKFIDLYHIKQKTR